MRRLAHGGGTGYRIELGGIEGLGIDRARLGELERLEQQAVQAPDRNSGLSPITTCPLLPRGIAAGRLYQFDAANARQHVAEADAGALLRTPFFARID